MNKNQKELVILLILMACVINYAFYSFYLDDRLKALKQKKEIYVQQKNNLEYIKNEAANTADIKDKISRLKVQSSSIDEQIPKYIDTPQLVYDFYNACKSYNVQGDKINFQLAQGSKNSGNGSDSQVVQNSVGTSDAQDIEKGNGNSASISSSEKSVLSGLARLSIQLNVSGSKDNMENFIKNLDKITKRKLNVNSINLTFSAGSSDGNISAVIVFDQYVQTDSKGNLNIPSETSSVYSFYNGSKPYNNITDMLQSGSK